MATMKNEKTQAQDEEFVKGKKKHMKAMCKHCKKDHKTSEHKKHEKHMKKDDKHEKKSMKHKKEGHKPKGAHGRAAVKALGRTKTTGNFAKIEKSKGKGAAIGAYQNALKAHQEGKKKSGGKEMLKKALKHLKH